MTAGKLTVSSSMKNLKFFCNHPITCYELANHVSLHVKNNREPDSCEVGGRSPRHKRSSATVSPHHQSSFFWLPTQKTGPQKTNPKDRTPERRRNDGRRDVEEALLQEQTKASGEIREGDQAGLSPHLLCYPCTHAEGNPVFMAACGTLSPGPPLQRSSFSLPLAKPHLKQLSTMRYNFKFYL